MKNTSVLAGLVITTALGVAFYPDTKAQVIVNPQPIVQPVTVNQNQERPVVEVVFALDTTGSMGGMIQAAKEKIWSIATTLASTDPAPEIRIGLVAYRDRGDAYVTKITDLSSDLDSVFSSLMQLQANGGGDTPESVNQALNEAVNKISWSKNQNAYQVIFLVGDAPGHTDYQDDQSYAVSIKQATERNIIVNSIQCGENLQAKGQWQEVAQLGGGEYLNVAQQGSAIASNTPYDTKIASLAKELEDTRIYYGSETKQAAAKARKKKSESLYASAPATSLAKRAEFNLSSSGEKNLLGENELLEDIASGKVSLDEVSEDFMPESMKEMEAEERISFVGEAKAKRDKLSKEIQTLTEQRQAFLKGQVAEKKEAKSSLDYQLFDTLRKQASKHGLEYEESDLSL